MADNLWDEDVAVLRERALDTIVRLLAYGTPAEQLTAAKLILEHGDQIAKIIADRMGEEG